MMRRGKNGKMQHDCLIMRIHLFYLVHYIYVVESYPVDSQAIITVLVILCNMSE